MPDVGGSRLPTLTVSPADGTTVATLVVVAPDGTTAATPVAGSGGNWAAVEAYTFTADGVWVERWTVTGTGKNVTYEHVIAVGVAQPVEYDPTALAHIGHLVAKIGRSLTAAEKLRAPALLADASDQIRGLCRRQFAPAASVVKVLRPIGNVLRLPDRPISAINSVEMIGTSGTADLELGITNWSFDGIDEIALWAYPAIVLGAPPTGSYANTYRVDYAIGGTTPQLLIGRICAIVLRHLLTPSPIAGMVSERIGNYSYQLGQFPGGGAPGSSVEVTDDDIKWLNRMGYRSSAGTIQLRG